LLTLTTLVNLN